MACVRIIGGDNNVIYFGWPSRYTCLLHLLVALTMHVDILPSIVANERQLVGSRADHFTILCMKFLAELYLLATHEMGDREKFGGGS